VRPYQLFTPLTHHTAMTLRLVFFALLLFALVVGMFVYSKILKRNTKLWLLVLVQLVLLSQGLQSNCPLSHAVGECVGGRCGTLNGIQLSCINGVCCLPI
jgi:pheromone shutdown protein TraB